MRGYKSVKQDVEEGWKSTLAGAALAGLGALGSGGAHAGGVSLNPDQGFQPQDQVTLNQRVQQQQNRQDLSSYSTDYLQKAADPNRFGRFMVSVDDAKAELQARENGKQQKVSPATTEKPTNGFSKDYLEKAADPQRFGRFLISVEKAQELLKKYSEVDEVTLKTTPYGRTAASQQRAAAAHAQFEKDWAKKQEAEKQKQGEKKPEQAVAEITGDGNFDNMMGKITDPAERERLAPIEVQQVVKFLKGSIESLLELLKNDPDFEPGDVRYNTDLRDMRKNLKSIMADSDPENVAAALFNYETEWRETMNGWAEEALGHALFSKLENLYYGEYGESLAEKMMPKSAFTGSNKNKLGSAGQWKNTGPSKNRAARAGDLVGGGAAQESINTVQWRSLGEELSVKDRMDIFEKFHTEGQLLESNEHYIKYFNNLNHYLINPTIGENYLVVPLVLIQNKLRLLDTDLSMLEFVDKQGDSVIFKTAKGQIIKYPSDQQSEVGIYKTFMFNNISTYNKFRSEVILKFNKPLPAVNIKDDKDKQVPISEDCENIMDVLINKIIVNEARKTK
jgi:hypothetical protein